MTDDYVLLICNTLKYCNEPMDMPSMRARELTVYPLLL